MEKEKKKLADIGDMAVFSCRGILVGKELSFNGNHILFKIKDGLGNISIIQETAIEKEEEEPKDEFISDPRD